MNSAPSTALPWSEQWAQCFVPQDFYGMNAGRTLRFSATVLGVVH